MYKTFLILAALVAILSNGLVAAEVDRLAIQKSVTFYASFDQHVAADFGKGVLELSTRYDHPDEKGKFVVEKGFREDIFSIAAKSGIHGGALQATDVMPRRGRIFFPAEGNLPFKPGGWSGSVSFWMNTDPNTMLKTDFCDPIQITQRRAGDGGLWIDFPNVKPRDLRLGAFRALAEGEKSVEESDPNAPLIHVKDIGFKQGDWHHLAMTWKNFDTGKNDAVAKLYIDGKLMGEMKDRDIAMKWELDKTGIYVAVSYIGLLDELTIFDRELSGDEVSELVKEPGLFTVFKKRKSAFVPPPKFPFDRETAQTYQRAYARSVGLPVTFVNHLRMEFQLIPPGTFVMGSPADEPGHGVRPYDETQHDVILTRPFYLSKHETTVKQFRRFVEADNFTTDGEKNDGGHAHDDQAVWKHRPGTSWLKPGFAGPYEQTEDHPVVHVSHHDATRFCEWLTPKLPSSLPFVQGIYVLPTEAEWEWACRAGSGSRFWWGADEDETGKRLNVGDQSLKKVHPEWPRETMPMNDGHAFSAPVGSYQANAFGLHDMLGNVWEFCYTRYGPYPKERTADPLDLDPNRGFAVRGGGWSNEPVDARCATRNADPPHFCHSNLGFRVAISIIDP